MWLEQVEALGLRMHQLFDLRRRSRLQRAYFGASIAGHPWLKGLFICSVSTQPGPDKPTLRKQATMDAPPGFGGPKACVPLMELHQPDCRNILRTP